MTSSTTSAKVTARGLASDTDKINAIVLACKVAISLRAGTCKQKSRKQTKESEALPQMCKNRCAPVVCVQRVNVFV